MDAGAFRHFSLRGFWVLLALALLGALTAVFAGGFGIAWIATHVRIVW
jgi:uncharacterized membrane protein